ncbi:DNA polymerase eta [Anticarsia gemmatalis]|uniref:DNA polymerase eta n=1 Tax=Anticarsia gemmatalis TaxID=129554 RepID=UPI003F75B198
MDQENRVVVLIDMDCFYCQVEEKLNPELKGKPIAVVQYNPWKGGGIIAVNYVARAQGVTRSMRGDEAKARCPDIQLPSVPCQRGKADISKYREAGKEVARVFQRFTPLLERASIDEAYLDITGPVEERLKTLNVNTVNPDMMPNTFALGYDCVEEFMTDIHTCGVENIDFDYEHAKRLLVGAVIVSEIRAAVYEETGYRCSAGIAHNKILAKLVCGFNKPNKQTVLPKHSVNILYSTLSVKKVKHLGGKFGDTVCEVLRISKMAELQKFNEKELQMRFDEKNGTWLYNIARGIDLEPVQARFNPKSIGCCKNFRGKAALFDLDSLRKWLKDLGDEIEDRLEKDALENNRTPKQMVVSYSVQMPDGRDTSSSRSYNFIGEDELCGELFSSKALELLVESSEGVKVKENENNRKLKAPIKFLGISVGKFEDISDSKKTKKILDYFTTGSSKDVTEKPKDNVKQEDKTIEKSKQKNSGKEYIMQKFFQVTNKPQPQNSVPCEETKQPTKTEANTRQNEPEASSTKPEQKPVQTHANNNQNKPHSTTILESTLDKQESFFAKMLKQNLKKDPQIRNIVAEETVRPITPVCDVVNCGEETNDTDYSGSTINEEIDKSMALFEDDPEEVARVTSIRQLMNTSNALASEDCETVSEPEANPQPVVQVSTPQIELPQEEMFDCSECGKSIPIGIVEMHSDYHLALRLRDEERQQVRKEKQDKTIIKTKPEETKKKRPQEEQNTSKNETIASVASFLVKIDNNIPTETCSECGKKVPLEKFGEHLDFHEAQKLSRELNKRVVPQLAGSNVKRKRKSASPVKKNKMPCRPIDSFFR